MKIICTPSSGPLALIADLESRTVIHQLDMPEGLSDHKPYGITSDNNGQWYIAVDDTIVFLDEKLRAKRVLGGLPQELRQLCHDAQSGMLWAVASSIDSLLAIDLKDDSVYRFCLITDEWLPFDAPGRNTHSFNSINWNGDHFHVVADKAGQGSSLVRTYNRQMQRVGFWNKGKEAHNAMEHEGELLLLDSRGGFITGNQKTMIPVCAPGDFARGMAITPEGIAIVAISNIKQTHFRNEGNACLRWFELATGAYAQEMALAGTGAIRDIALLPGA